MIVGCTGVIAVGVPPDFVYDDVLQLSKASGRVVARAVPPEVEDVGGAACQHADLQEVADRIPGAVTLRVGVAARLEKVCRQPHVVATKVDAGGHPGRAGCAVDAAGRSASVVVALAHVKVGRADALGLVVDRERGVALNVFGECRLCWRHWRWRWWPGECWRWRPSWRGGRRARQRRRRRCWRGRRRRVARCGRGAPANGAATAVVGIVGAPVAAAPLSAGGSGSEKGAEQQEEPPSPSHGRDC